MMSETIKPRAFGTPKPPTSGGFFVAHSRPSLMTDEQESHPLLVEVAVPLPLPHALTYKVPAAYRRLAVPGARARGPG